MPRIASHHLHWHWHYEFDNTPTMKWLFVVRFLRDFVSHLTTFFVPIYIYQQVVQREVLGFLSGTELQRGMTGIALYFLIYRLTTLVTAIPMAKLGTKFGHVTVLVLSHLFFLAYLATLFGTRWYPLLIGAAAIFDGLQACCFWPSYQTLISRAATKKKIGQDLGVIQFLLRLATLMSPAIGGAIIMSFGFSIVCLVGLVGVILSMVAISNITTKPEKDKVSWVEFRRWLRQSTFDKLALTYLGRYFNDAALVIWPVYVFLTLGTIERVGFLYSLSLFLAMILTFLTGVYVDRVGSRKPFMLTGAALSLLWLARIQIWSFWQIAIVNTLDKLTADFHWLFYDTQFIKRGQGKQAYSYFTYREIVLSMSGLVFWSAIIGLFSLITNSWASVFVLGAIGVLLSLYIKDTHR